jgi:hypothetical protein
MSLDDLAIALFAFGVCVGALWAALWWVGVAL